METTPSQSWWQRFWKTVLVVMAILYVVQSIVFAILLIQSHREVKMLERLVDEQKELVGSQKEDIERLQKRVLRSNERVGTVDGGSDYGEASQ